jgi:hypothetical protein
MLRVRVETSRFVLHVCYVLLSYFHSNCSNVVEHVALYDIEIVMYRRDVLDPMYSRLCNVEFDNDEKLRRHLPMDMEQYRTNTRTDHRLQDRVYVDCDCMCDAIVHRMFDVNQP